MKPRSKLCQIENAKFLAKQKKLVCTQSPTMYLREMWLSKFNGTEKVFFYIKHVCKRLKLYNTWEENPNTSPLFCATKPFKRDRL